ncbi:VUT family protein, partial [Pseudomonas protegens]
MTAYEGDIENSKYKLLGFENNKNLAVIMIIDTGKVIKIKLSEVVNSEIMDNLNKMEVKNLYKKFYSQGGTLTAYDLNDRNENSWMIYIILNLLLFTFYIFTSIAATKPIYLESLDIIITPGTFLYPLTFLIVDLLNENFGLRLARRAILFAFASNAMIIILLYASTFLPGLPGWKLDTPYN